MNKERLSRLQKNILLSLLENSGGYYSAVYERVRKRILAHYDWVKDETLPAKAKVLYAQLGSSREIYYDDSLKCSFSRSIRNLRDKDLVRLSHEFLMTIYSGGELKNYWYHGSSKVSDIEITNKGLLLISNININEGWNNLGVGNKKSGVENLPHLDKGE